MALAGETQSGAVFGVESSINSGTNPALNPDVVKLTKRVLSQCVKEVDLNGYTSAKTLSQGILDLTLLASHLILLRRLLTKEQDHDYYTPLLILIAITITFQILIGILLLFVALGDINSEFESTMERITNGVYKGSSCQLYYCYYGESKCRCVQTQSTLSRMNVFVMFMLLLMGILNIIVVVMAG